MLINLALLNFTASCVSVEIKDTKDCAVAGDLRAGMICTHTLNDTVERMDLQHSLDWLQPQNQRPDPDNIGQTLPAHGAALCRSANDYLEAKNELEEACRILGKRCTLEMQKTIDHMKQMLDPITTMLQ